MLKCTFAVLFILIWCISMLFCVNIPKQIVVGVPLPLSISGGAFGDMYSGTVFALNSVNNNNEILPNTTLIMEIINTDLRAPLALSEAINFLQEGKDVLLCCATSNEMAIAGTASTVFEKVFLGSLASSSELSDRSKYPFLARISSPDDYQARVIVDLLEYYKEKSGLHQYVEVGIIIVTGLYGISGANQLLDDGRLTIKTYQQFLEGAKDVSVEVNELKSSKARVFIAIMNNVNEFQTLMIEAQKQGLIGDQYIWTSFDGTTTDYIFSDTYSGLVNEMYVGMMSGLIGINLGISSGKIYQNVFEEWQTLDPEQFPTAGPNSSMSVYSQYSYDSVLFLAQALSNLIEAGGFDENGKIISTSQFYEILLNSTVSGVTGEIILDPLGNRYPNYDILNVVKGDPFFTNVGKWNIENELQLTSDIHFHDGTTRIPDIDVRPPFNYWSCKYKEKRTDLTGKSITIRTPDGDNPNEIDYDYYCDSFIDCENFSDESVNCSNNYMVVFIVYGIVTGIAALIAIFFFIFTIIFGFCFTRRKVRAASPLFLIIVALSCFVGIISTYAWYGKPQKVACGFQPWLLGVAITSLVSALCAKTFRIWRIFKSPFDRKIITDLELVILWIAMMLPSLFILFLWTLISTPTARMVKIDGEKHYICASGGFTGSPGGFIFFFVLVGYIGILLLFGAFLSIVTRKVPSLFNESKLIGISIYNLVFLSVILIPVVIVLDSINPFISWIIRTTGVLYAFFATLLLQFLPKLKGLCKNTDPKSTIKDLADLDFTSGSTFQNIPEAEND